MTATPSPFGERSLTIVGAVFPNRRWALSAADELQRAPDLRGEVSVVAPDDPLAARKMEPESAGIWRTALRSHAILGAIGLVAGLAVTAALYFAGWPPTVTSPLLTAVFASALGVFFGMLLAGLLTLRPDHGFVIEKMREGIERGRWAVVVRPESEADAEFAERRLRAMGSTPVRSL